MDDNRLNALESFLSAIPESVRVKGKQYRCLFEVDDREESVEARLRANQTEPLTARVDFDAHTGAIVGAHCGCVEARLGKICAHLSGLADQLIDDSLTPPARANSLDFLDKHFNAPAFQSAQFQLSVDIEEAGDELEPAVFIHKFIKEGAFGAGRKFTANDSYKFTHGEPADQNLLDYLKIFRQVVFYSNYETAKRYNWGFWLALVNHPRVSLGDKPLTVAAVPAELTLIQEEDGYRLGIRHGKNTPAGLKYFEVDGGLLALSRREGKLLICQTSAFSAAVLMEVSQLRPKLSRGELIANLPRLEKLQAFFDLELPADFDDIVQPAEPRLALQLDLQAGHGLTIYPRIAYAGTKARLAPGARGRYLSGGDSQVLERNLEAEEALLEEFLGLFPYPLEEGEGPDIGIDDLTRAQALLEWFKEQPWPVEWLREEVKITPVSHVQGLRVQVDAKAWLKIHLMADGRDIVIDYFPEEDQRLADGAYVAVGEREWLQIDEELRRRLNQIKMAIAQEDRAMKLRKAAMAVLADMPDLSWEGDPDWLARIETWRARGKDRFRPSQKLQTKLRKYQLEGYRWLRRLSELGAGACLADDMGLGKTIQALAVMIDRAKTGPALVITPASVCFNWREETKRFAPTLNPILYAEGRRRKIAKLKNNDVLIMSYAMALRDVEKLSERRWHTLILDEAQFIKNPMSQTAIAVARLPRDWTLALTGTPLENHLGELWSVFRMLNPDLLGPWDHFRRTYAQPIERGQDPQKLDSLRRLLKPFILRRTKQNVLDDLPDRDEVDLKVELGDAQRARYEQERQRILAQLDEMGENGGARFKLLAAITRLRQMACHPALCDDRYKGESAKLTMFSELVEELVSESHKVLVFSQFTSFLSIIGLELNRIHVPHLILTGETPVKHRQAIIDKFQNGDTPVFLISLRAGGTGLNLTSANYVIHMDPWWNPAVEEQATDRAHRIGQTRAVTVYRLIANGTIEEAILNIHDRKRDLVENILAGKDQAAKLSIKDLVSLLQGQLV